MTPDQGTVVLLRSLAIDPCIVRKLRLRSRLLRWARCKAILKSHAHPEMPFCRFRMARMARPALNHQRARIALVAQRWPTSSLRSSASLLASPSPQDSSLQVLLCRRHALPDTNVTVCSDRAGDHGAALYHSIAVPGPKLASRGRTFPVHPAASRCWPGQHLD